MDGPQVAAWTRGGKKEKPWGKFFMWKRHWEIRGIL